MLSAKLVQQKAVISRDILHINDIFQPSLYLETHRSAFQNEFVEKRRGVEVFHVQKRSIANKAFAVRLEERVIASARLTTVSAVRTPAREVLAHVTLPAERTAQSSVNEDLQFHLGKCAMYVCHLLYRQFPCKNHTAETDFAQYTNLLLGRTIRLSGSMKRQFYVIEFRHCGILNDEGIDSRFGKSVQSPPCVLQFLVIEDCIHGHINLYAEKMCILHRLANILRRIACRNPCPEAFEAHIDCVCSRIYGGKCSFKVASR